MAVDGDYEEGQFIEGEYFYGKKRDKRKQTKDVRNLGIRDQGLGFRDQGLGFRVAFYHETYLPS